jgi:hypothetical protein
MAGFFARLGYDTGARRPQTAGNLGITADSTAGNAFTLIMRFSIFIAAWPKISTLESWSLG